MPLLVSVVSSGFPVPVLVFVFVSTPSTFSSLFLPPCSFPLSFSLLPVLPLPASASAASLGQSWSLLLLVLVVVRVR